MLVIKGAGNSFEGTLEKLFPSNRGSGIKQLPKTAAKICCTKESDSNLKRKTFVPSNSKHQRLVNFLQNSKLFDAIGCLNKTEQDIDTFNAFINFFVCKNNPQIVYQQFNEMKEKGIVPNTTTYNLLIELHVQREEGEEALKLFTEMKNSPDFPPDIETYHFLMELLLKADKMKNETTCIADSFRKEMENKRLIFTPATYSLLLDLYAIQDQDEKRLDLLAEMDKKGIAVFQAK